MDRVFRVDESYRTAHQGSVHSVLLGLIPSSAPVHDGPQMRALPGHQDGAPDRVDPEEVRACVTRALDEVERSSGTRLYVKAIEYVPNDSAAYEQYYYLARRLAHHLIAEGPTELD